jgi:hypothetical protein
MDCQLVDKQAHSCGRLKNTQDVLWLPKFLSITDTLLCVLLSVRRLWMMPSIHNLFLCYVLSCVTHCSQMSVFSYVYFSKTLVEYVIIIRLTLSLLMSYIYGAPSKARNLTSYIYERVFFPGDFASCAVHFVNICVKNQQIHQLFIQFINYVW